VADIKISRKHELGLTKARDVAFKWAEDAEKNLDMSCTYVEGEITDEVQFTRSGVSGTLHVTASGFTLHAKLGFIASAFKDKIEAEIEKNLDALLAPSKASAKKVAPKKKA
jgi:putative polyhydroxyalkanoate system protein